MPKNGQKRLPGSGFGCLAAVSAATAGSRQESLGAVRRCRRSLPNAKTRAEMAKSAVRKGKITLSAASREKKKTVPLSGTNDPQGSWGQVWA